MKRAILLVAGAALVLAGCAGTRSTHFGLLAQNEPLVTLIVSEDRQVIDRECLDPEGARRMLGCQTSRVVDLPGGVQVKAIKIVRYTDSLPSEMAFEIDVHELCHAIAAAQGIADPCHQENNGTIQAAVFSPPPTRWR
ncbi:MAG: hypothetical protein HY616_03070 [Candidatus Rokubacteria bacterium]|nr:hypothetical protein [Candidatus Rokubacteria bacterium]